MASIRFSISDVLIVLTLLPLNIGFVAGVDELAYRLVGVLVNACVQPHRDWHLAVEHFFLPTSLGLSHLYASLVCSISSAPGWIAIFTVIMWIKVISVRYRMAIGISMALAIPLNALYVVGVGPWYFRPWVDSPYLGQSADQPFGGLFHVVFVPYWIVGIFLVAVSVVNSVWPRPWCCKAPAWAYCVASQRASLVAYSACSIFGWIVLASHA